MPIPPGKRCTLSERASDQSFAQIWARSRAGARAGRGFRFQDAAAAAAAILCWSGRINGNAVVPEGLDDFSIETRDSIINVQVKSKISDKSTFQVSDLASLLTSSVATKLNEPFKEGSAKQVILIDRPLNGECYENWEQLIEGLPVLAGQFRSILDARTTDSAAVKDLLSMSTLVTWTAPISVAAEEIVAKRKVPLAAALCCVHRILVTIGNHTDSNATAAYDRRSKLTIGEVEHEIDSVLGLIDWTSIDAAVRKGIVEYIDFGTALTEPNYYLGVATQPGHVSAGLTFPRESLTDAIIETLASHHRVLISGPSGTGKSAAALMAAFETRHACRWVQLRKLPSDDYEDVRRFVAAQAPSGASPIVLYVDNAGRGSATAWEVAVEISLSMPHVFVVACAREEDLAIMSGLDHFRNIRPTLDNEFAERMWRQLKQDNATNWTSWREPLENSKGLLLEYAHILTQGRRLSEVVTDQVNQRLIDKRDGELDVLRLTSAAASLGASVSTSLLAKHLKLSSVDCARALQRLIDEHLVRRIGSDEITGLHELRSQCILASCLELMPGSIADMREEALAIVSANGMPSMIVASIRLGQLNEATIVNAVAKRLGMVPEPGVLVGGLEGLKLCTLDRDAEAFKAIADKHNVAPRFYFLIMIAMLLPSQQSGGGAFKVLEAVRDEFALVRGRDFRSDLLAALTDEQYSAVLRNIKNSEETFRLFRSLAGLELGPRTLELRALSRTIAGDIKEIASIMAIAGDLSPVLAQAMADDLGGTDKLLDRLCRETTWALRPTLTKEADGSIELLADLLAVEEPLLKESDAIVYEYASRALALAPNAKRITSRPLPITGQAFTIGEYSPGLKSFGRTDSSNQATITWNRLLLHTVSLRYAAKSITEAMQRRKETLEAAAQRFALHADRRCRGRKPTSLQDAELRALALLEDIYPAVPLEKPESALAVGALKGDLTDSASELITDIVAACRRFYDSSIDGWLLAFDMERIVKATATCRKDPRWMYVSGAPVEALQRIEQLAQRLYESFLATSKQGGVPLSLVMMPSSQTWTVGAGVGKAHNRAARQRERKLAEIKTSLATRFVSETIKVHFITARPTSLGASSWPDDDICLLAECASEVDFLGWLGANVESLQGERNHLASLTVAPIIGGRIIVPWALRILSTAVVPETEFAGRWKDSTDWLLFESKTLPAFEEAFGKMIELYAVQELMAGRKFLAAELRYLEECQAKSHAALKSLRDTLSDQPELLEFIVEFLTRLNDSFTAPVTLENTKPAVELARQLFAGFGVTKSDSLTDIQVEMLKYRMIIVERELEQLAASI